MESIDIRIQAQVVGSILIVDLHAKQGDKLSKTAWRSGILDGVEHFDMRKALMEMSPKAIEDLFSKLK